MIKHVSVEGESGAGARPCDYAWVEDVHKQCVENRIMFYYHQTGAKLVKDGKIYNIPRLLQHSKAHKARLDTPEWYRFWRENNAINQKQERD